MIIFYMASANSRQLRLLTTIISFSLSFDGLNAQDKPVNALYIEFASRGPVYAIHYDRIFRQGQRLDYSFSGGFSIAKNAVAFPVGIHFITGVGDHHAEFGLSIIPYIDYNHHLPGSNKDQTDKYIYINPGLGYRYQPKKTGLFFKASIGPSVFLDPPSDDFWNMDPKLYGFGSVALGISF